MGCAPRSISTRYNPAMDDAAIEHTLRVFFQTRAPEVSAAHLFGSVARGTSGTASDVDVAVLLARPPADGLDGLPLDLEGELERLLAVPVQVVVLNRTPADLIHRVLRDGKLLVDRALRIAFEVRARNEFFDLKPVLDQYRAIRGPDR